MPIRVEHAPSQVLIDPRVYLAERRRALAAQYAEPVDSLPVIADALIEPVEEPTAAEPVLPTAQIQNPAPPFGASRTTPRAVALPDPVEEMQRRIVARNQDRRDIEEAGRAAERERLTTERRRSVGTGSPTLDMYSDRRGMAYDLFRDNLKNKIELEAFYRGQTAELSTALFDPKETDPGEGWAYTEAQRQELQRLAADANSIIADPRLTEEERYRAMTQVYNKRRTIRPNKTQERPVPMAEQWEAETVPVTDPMTGEVVGYAAKDRSGAFRVIHTFKRESPKQTAPSGDDGTADYQRNYLSFRKHAEQLEQQRIAGGDDLTPASEEEIHRRTLELMQRAGYRVPSAAVIESEDQGPLPASVTPDAHPAIGDLIDAGVAIGPDMMQNPEVMDLLDDMAAIKAEYPDPASAPPEVADTVASIVDRLRWMTEQGDGMG